MEQTRKEWTVGSYPTLARIFLPLAAKLVDPAGAELLRVTSGYFSEADDAVELEYLPATATVE